MVLLIRFILMFVSDYLMAVFGATIYIRDNIDGYFRIRWRYLFLSGILWVLAALPIWRL